MVRGPTSTVTVYPPVPPPPSGLGSNSNYTFANAKCGSFPGLSLVFDVSEQIAATNGFSLQLQIYSQNGFFDTWQQYVMGMYPNSGNIFAGVNNWSSITSYIIDDFINLATIPTFSAFPNWLPAGSVWVMNLIMDAANNITGCHFVAQDATGAIVGNQTINLLSSFPLSDLAPAGAFTANLVGPFNLLTTSLVSGMGTISYTSPSLDFEAMTNYPLSLSCLNGQNDFVTGELANSTYGELPPISAKVLQQSFAFSTTASPINKLGRKTITGTHPRRLG